MRASRKLLAAGLLFVVAGSCNVFAGLRKPDNNHYDQFQQNLTDFPKYRYAALVPSPGVVYDFDAILRLSRIYAGIINEDMNINARLYEYDNLNIKSIENYRAYANQLSTSKGFLATSDTCSAASTFLYPSVVSGLLRVMAPELILLDHPELHQDLVNVSKHELASDMKLLGTMCNTPELTSQNVGFIGFVDEIRNRQAYIVNGAHQGLIGFEAVERGRKESAALDDANKKVLASKAARDEADQEVEDARQAKKNADRAAEIAAAEKRSKEAAEERRGAQEEARKKIQASLPRTETSQILQANKQRPFDIPKANRFIACSALVNSINEVAQANGSPANEQLSNLAFNLTISGVVYSNADYVLDNATRWDAKYRAELGALPADRNAWLSSQLTPCNAIWKENFFETKIYYNEAKAEFLEKADDLIKHLKAGVQ